MIFNANWILASTTSISTQGSALGTDKSDSTVGSTSATQTVFTIPEGWTAIEIRFKGVMTDADSNVVNMYAMRGSDDYILIDTYTLTTGTQTDGTNNYVDTIASSAPLWPSEIEIMSGADNSIARVAFNTHGYKKLCFIATTLNSTSLIIDVARAA